MPSCPQHTIALYIVATLFECDSEKFCITMARIGSSAPGSAAKIMPERRVALEHLIHDALIP
eukprot:scaffold188190_cov29-Prasinocladus_malaysianus.AAC.1